MKAGENALNQLRVAQRTGDKLIIAKGTWNIILAQCTPQKRLKRLSTRGKVVYSNLT